MGLLDDLEPKKHVYSCKVRTLADTLDEADRAKMLEAVEGELWRPEALSRELTKRGLAITKFPIIKHREKACSCSKI